MLLSKINRKNWAETGFILPVVLLFLQLFVLYILYALSAGVLSTKMSGQYTRKIHNTREIDQIIAEIERNVAQQRPTCLINPTPLPTLMAQPESWWQSQSCSGSFHTTRYYYVLETLGDDPCAPIDKATAMIADYYRITLLSIDKSSGIKAMVQVTQAIPVAETNKCNEQMHLVKSGQQSSRLVS